MKHPNDPLTGACDETLLAYYTTTQCEDAFAEFHQRHYDETLRFIRRRVSNTHDAEDLTQETFLSIHQHHTTYDPSQPAKAWLLQIAMNHIRKFRRKAKMAVATAIETPIEGTVPDPSQSTPSTILLRQEANRTLQQLIACLPARERQIILDLYFSGLRRSLVRSNGCRRHQRRRALRLLRRMTDNRDLSA
jgi:RNA polymerase sigma-70 factor (ECF subfamily)